MVKDVILPRPHLHILLFRKYLITFMRSQNSIARINGMCEPYVTADNAVITNDGTATEYCGAGIYNDIVTDVWMTFDTFDKCSVRIGGEALRTERNALI